MHKTTLNIGNAHKTSKQSILILFGGESPEHEVSIKSATNIVSAVDTTLYSILLGYIDVTGTWWLVSSIEDALNPVTRKPILPLLGESSITTGQGDSIVIDVIFPVLHGPNGEDGTIQSLAKLLHTPIVGCDATSSALCMDKVLTKQVVSAAGIPVTPGLVATTYEHISYQQASHELGNTLFVKPSSQGSSVGVNICATQADYDTALQIAFGYGDKVLIETAITAREIEVAVLSTEDGLRVSEAGEIIPDRAFYDYDSKYDDNSVSQVLIPAPLTDISRTQITAYAQQAFSALGCRGLARIDFFIDHRGNIFLNEVNTMPGFTNISMYPKLWQASGVSYEALVSQLIRRAQ